MMALKISMIVLFIIVLFVSMCIYFTKQSILKNIQIQEKAKQTRANAFITSTNCNSARFNFTKNNIERVFPKFFIIYCFKPILLNDSRIDQSLSLLGKKLASNLISFATLCTYEISKYATGDELEWSFMFEDDVDFVEPSKFGLSSYLDALQQLMYHPEVQIEDGVFYLGICGPTFAISDHSLPVRLSNNSLLIQKGCGRCAHGMGFTTKRAKHFWTDISLYCPIPNGPADIYIHKHCAKTGNYYILGSNLHWPPGSRHYGIAFQDRQRFHSQVWWNVADYLNAKLSSMPINSLILQWSCFLYRGIVYSFENSSVQIFV